MMSLKLKLLPVKIVAFFAQKMYSAKCPVELGKECETSGQCAGDKCYRDLDGTPNKTLYYCCRMSCPVTKLLTFHSHYDNTYLHKMDDKMSKEGLYYKDATSSIACPYPYSLLTIKIEKVLPEGFSVNSTTELKNCNTNGDCGEGFYCGYSVNPSFGRGDSKVADESDSGNPIKLCFKNPNVDSKFVIAFDASGFSLPICNEHSECLRMGAICYRYGKANDTFMGRNTIDHRGGLCVKAILCNVAGESTMSVAIPARNDSFCANADDCKGIRDEIFKPECVPVQHPNMTGVSLCCFTPSMCEQGTAIIPKHSCNSSADCNLGATGPWTSWCDDKGYCCQDTTGTVKPLCPDGHTLAFNEDKCDGKCKNGVCINGRCCPGLVVEKEKVTLGDSPYITKMPCDPKNPLPEHVRFSYCSPDGFVVVIGKNDAFGEAFLLDGEKECEKNEDCQNEGDKTMCIRGDSASSACNRNPLKQYPKGEVGEAWYLSVWPYFIIGGIVTIVIMVIVACWPKIKKMKKARKNQMMMEENRSRKQKKADRKRERRYNEALAKFEGFVKQAAARRAPMYDRPLLDNNLPELTYNNVILVVQTGWKKYAALNNLPAHKVKCYYDYATFFLTKVDYIRQKARFAQMKPIGTHYKCEPDILNVDLINGNTPKPDISLKDIRLNPAADRRCALEEGDDMENDPSTVDTENESLEVDRTQSDRSNRARAGNEEEDEEEDDKLIHTVVYLINKEILQSPDEALRRIKEDIDKKVSDENNKNRSRFSKAAISVLMSPFSGACYAYNTVGNIYQQIVGNGIEPEIDGNHDTSLPERFEAGRDKQPWSFDRYATEKMDTYKQNVAEVSFNERVTTIKYALAHGDEMLTRTEFYDNLIAAYNGKWKNSPGKEVETLDEALVDVCQAIKEFGENRNLLDRKFAVYLNKLRHKVTPQIWKEAIEVLDKLIELDRSAMHLQTRAELLYAHLQMNDSERHSLFDTTELYVNKMMGDLNRANELLPNQPRTFVLMALIQKRKGDMAAARRYLHTATRIQPTNADEAAQKREAIEVNRTL